MDQEHPARSGEVPGALGLRRRIVALAQSEGFELISFAAAPPLLRAREAALTRRQEGHLDGMGWLTTEWLTRATDPGAFLEGAATVVMLALPCHSSPPVPSGAPLAPAAVSPATPRAAITTACSKRSFEG